MKNLSYLFIVLFMAFSTVGILTINSSANAQSKHTHSSHVIVKVPGLTLEQYNKVAAYYMKIADVEIAYYCLESGIMAFHYNHSGLSKADVQSALKAQLQKLIKNSNIRILDVEMRSAEDNSRC